MPVENITVKSYRNQRGELTFFLFDFPVPNVLPEEYKPWGTLDYYIEKSFATYQPHTKKLHNFWDTICIECAHLNDAIAIARKLPEFENSIRDNLA